jgi:hypothetical protein
MDYSPSGRVDNVGEKWHDCCGFVTVVDVECELSTKIQRHIFGQKNC